MLHTHNDELRLGRCLETLYPCDEILVIDHDSEDRTLRVAHDYAARLVRAAKFGAPEQHLLEAGWLLCLDPRESLTEALAATLYSWKSEPCSNECAFSMLLREETSTGWVKHRQAQTRLVPAGWRQWSGSFPISVPTAQTLEGEILRFSFP